MAVKGVFLGLLLVLPALAGCFGDDEPEAPAAVTTPEINETAVNATLPDGRGESAGLKETNKTEEGVGGIEHLHDYWGGAETAVLMDERVYVPFMPLFPEGEGSDPRNVGYVRLPAGALVYEGAEKVTVTITDAKVQTTPTHPVSAPYPAPPEMSLEYLTAADNEWRDAGGIAWGAAVDLAVSSRETDMPHSNASLWVFRFLTDKPGASKTFHMNVVAHKGANVVDWPGHPDFYADADRRTVLDTVTVKTKVHGSTQSIVLYDEAGSWVNPERLVSWGTDHLEVEVTVKAVTSQVEAAQADSFYLEFHDATQIGAEINNGEAARDASPPDDLLGPWVFTVPVTEAGMDGPYQPASRWGFRVRATFGNGQLCPGCFDYEIEYEIKVVATTVPAT